ncbi:hypothetical protein Taro_002360 [Colocasia esculenta]|uniref:Uncharacterized protein n=1 Tax=Colocasia esculenta TaxID=4460 RepID=A0A843TGC3_COLES|nr:hypothetical protein [Colocasia esculenta]
MVYACENAYLWIYLSSRVETPKNEEEASRTPSSHEILSSLTSSPRPATFGNELGSAKRVYEVSVAFSVPDQTSLSRSLQGTIAF